MSDGQRRAPVGPLRRVVPRHRARGGRTVPPHHHHHRRARHVVTTIRVGQEQGRALDERLALRHGVLGQETTGPGGFAMALRSIPAILDYARLLQEVSPGAWMYNFTNPAGLVAQALQDAGGSSRFSNRSMCSHNSSDTSHNVGMGRGGCDELPEFGSGVFKRSISACNALTLSLNRSIFSAHCTTRSINSSFDRLHKSVALSLRVLHFITPRSGSPQSRLLFG